MHCNLRQSDAVQSLLSLILSPVPVTVLDLEPLDLDLDLDL